MTTKKPTFAQSLAMRDPDALQLEVKNMQSGDSTTVPIPADCEFDTGSDIGEWLAAAGFSPGRYALKLVAVNGWPGGRKAHAELGPLSSVCIVPGDPAHDSAAPVDDSDPVFNDARAVAAETQLIKNKTAQLKALAEMQAVQAQLGQSPGGNERGVDPLLGMVLQKLDAIASPRSSSADWLRVVVPLAPPFLSFVQALILNRKQESPSEFLKLFQAFNEVRSELAADSNTTAGEMSFLGEMGSIINGVAGLAKAGGGGELAAAAAAAESARLPIPSAGTNGTVAPNPTPAPQPEPQPQPQSAAERGQALARQRVRELADALQVEFYSGADPLRVAEQLDDVGAIASLPTPVRALFERGSFSVSALREWLDDAELEQVVSTFGTGNGVTWITTLAHAFGADEDDAETQEEHERGER